MATGHRVGAGEDSLFELCNPLLVVFADFCIQSIELRFQSIEPAQRLFADDALQRQEQSSY